MNKLTSTNYAKQRDIILEEIDKCCCEEEGEDEEYQNGCKIAKRFLEIVAMNKTSAKLFADVFHEVVAHYHQASGRSRVGAGVGAGAAARKMGAAFEDTLAEFKRTLESSFEAIHYEDPNTNYDGYCVYVKKNEERKAAVIFIVYFCCYTSGGDGGGGGGDGGGGDGGGDVDQRQEIINMIRSLQEIIFTYIELDLRVNEVEEITEVLFVIVTHGLVFLKHLDVWNDDLLPKFKRLAALKAKEFRSLSSRAVFKNMDLVDFVKKN